MQNIFFKLILLLSILLVQKNKALSFQPIVFLTPRNSIETAYANRPDLKRAFYNIRASERMSRVALSGYLPQITAEGGAGRAAPQSFFAPERFAIVHFSQLLYSPAGPIEEFRIARQITRSLEWDRIILEDKIRFETETALLDLWLSQQKDTLVRAYDKSSSTTYKQHIHENKLGLSDQAEWLQQNAEFAKAKARIHEYTDELTQNSSNLEKSLGIICTSDTAIDSQEINSMIDYAFAHGASLNEITYYKDALANRAELRMIDERIKQERYLQSYFGLRYFPSISLYTNVIKYWYLQSLFEGALASGWNAGIKFDWQFDGLANVFNKSAAGEREFAAMMDRIDMIAKIKQEVYTNFANLQTALKDFIASQTEYERAQNEIILSKKRYEVGLLSSVDIQRQKTVWRKAQHDFLTNKVTVAKQYRTLMYSCGYPKNLNHNKSEPS